MRLFTKEQLESAAKLEQKAEAVMMEKYGRLIYAAPSDDLELIAAEWAARKQKCLNANPPDKR